MNDNFEYKECPYCGFNVEKDATFCPYCGQKLDFVTKSDTEEKEPKADNRSIVTENKTSEGEEAWIQEWKNKAKSANKFVLISFFVSLALLIVFIALLLLDKKEYDYSSVLYSSSYTTEKPIYIFFVMILSLVTFVFLLLLFYSNEVYVKKIEGDTYLAYSGYIRKEIVRNGQVLYCEKTTYYRGCGRSRHVDAVVLRTTIGKEKELIVTFSNRSGTLFEVVNGARFY